MCLSFSNQEKEVWKLLITVFHSLKLTQTMSTTEECYLSGHWHQSDRGHSQLPPQVALYMAVFTWSHDLAVVLRPQDFPL